MVDPDNFLIKVDVLIDSTKDLDVIYICHQGRKSNSFRDEDIDYFKFHLNNPNSVILEPSALRSAFILLAHNMNSLVGSDVKDWDQYDPEYQLPELKIKLDSFNNFKKLIKKDNSVIKSYLESKLTQTIKIFPFDDSVSMEIPIYQEINVIFGGKGTGKTSILRKIEDFYKEKGRSIATYYASDKAKKFENITDYQLEEDDISNFNLSSYCNEDFEKIRNTTFPSPTLVSIYANWIKTRGNNTKKFCFANLNTDDDVNYYKSQCDNYIKSNKKLVSSFRTILENVHYKSMDESFKRDFELRKDELINRSIEQTYESVFKYYSVRLKEFTFKRMQFLYMHRTGNIAKPQSTGLIDIARTFIKLNQSIINIYKFFSTENKRIYKTIGNILDKGPVKVCKELSINPDYRGKRGQKLSLLRDDLRKTDLEELKSKINKIAKMSFSDNYISEVIDLKKNIIEKKIKTIKDFLFCLTYTVLSDNMEYGLSNGEQSMVILNNSILDLEKEVYILDEPEMSVGHKFVNEIIVKQIVNLAKANKIVIVSTHDANIAVRTLPYLSLYREDLGRKEYKTYIGSAFCEYMESIIDKNDKISWVEKSIEVLEGGREAFNERGEIYGSK